MLGKREGNGKMTWHKIGATYKGEWKDDKFHGFGTHITRDGEEYEGE